VRYDTESYEVDDAYVAVQRGDVGVESKAWAKEGGAMLAADQRDGSDEQGNGEDDYARVFAAAGHGVSITRARHRLTLVRALRQFRAALGIAR
jgi:hypothetical protein